MGRGVDCRYNRDDLVYVLCCYDTLNVHPGTTITTIIQKVGVVGER